MGKYLEQMFKYLPLYILYLVRFCLVCITPWVGVVPGKLILLYFGYIRGLIRNK